MVTIDSSVVQWDAALASEKRKCKQMKTLCMMPKEVIIHICCYLCLHEVKLFRLCSRLMNEAVLLVYTAWCHSTAESRRLHGFVRSGKLAMNRTFDNPLIVRHFLEKYENILFMHEFSGTPQSVHADGYLARILSVRDLATDRVASTSTLCRQIVPFADGEGNQPEITHSMRGILVDWLGQVALATHLSQQCLYAAIALLDQCDKELCIPKRCYQMLGAACLLVEYIWSISDTSMQMGYVLTHSKMTYFCNGVCTVEDMMETEQMLSKRFVMTRMHSPVTRLTLVEAFCRPSYAHHMPEHVALLRVITHMSLLDGECSQHVTVPALSAAIVFFFSLQIHHLSSAKLLVYERKLVTGPDELQRIFRYRVSLMIKSKALNYPRQYLLN